MPRLLVTSDYPMPRAITLCFGLLMTSKIRLPVKRWLKALCSVMIALSPFVRFAACCPMEVK